MLPKTLFTEFKSENAHFLIGNRLVFISQKTEPEIAQKPALEVIENQDKKKIEALALEIQKKRGWPIEIAMEFAKVDFELQKSGEVIAEKDRKLEKTVLELEKAVEEGKIDGLTKILNKKGYDEGMAKEIERFLRYGGKSFSLVIFDIDHFKRFNDTYGHPVGNRVLKEVARILKEKARGVDIVTRYGGEEFAVILPETNMEGAGITAQKLVMAIEEETKGKDYPPVTISAGYATFNPIDSELCNADLLFEKADAALYNAKIVRNRASAYVKGMKIPERKKEEAPGASGLSRTKEEKIVAKEIAVHPEKMSVAETESLELIRQLLPKDPEKRKQILRKLNEEETAVGEK